MRSETSQRRNPSDCYIKLCAELALLPRLKRIKIVRKFIRQLTDRVHLLICHLYESGEDDETVCKALKLTSAALESHKHAIGEGILAVMSAKGQTP